MRVFSNTLWKETPLAFSFHETPLWSLSLPLPYSVSSIYSFERHSETAQKVNCPETILFIFSQAHFIYIYHVHESITAGRTVILSVKPLAFIGEAKQCCAHWCQCLTKLFTLAEKHIPIFTPFGLIAGASLLVNVKPCAGKRTFSLKSFSTSPVKCTKAVNQGKSLISIWIMPSLPC